MNILAQSTRFGEEEANEEERQKAAVLRINDAIQGRLKSKLQAAQTLNKTMVALNRLSAQSAAKVRPEDAEAASSTTGGGVDAQPAVEA